ncbi:sulfotransferase family 2 domain-containing protein [Shewanella youngdeokensis]|uniref:Sulfotransferase family 2 domain-containing protein n=1 Tax=Shewanella youngdeokensis TaxID=2999068 RepID=A0ABZ0K310_9GAMM|nr:sulfotransferase family 2 domain-containing protein [Shewanella sp. DAU334]
MHHALPNGAEDYLKPALAHNRIDSGLSFVTEQTHPIELIGDKTIPKYAFVRNPYSRVLSAYLNKIEPYAEGVRGENDDNNYFYRVYTEVDAYHCNNLPLVSKVNFYCFLLWLTNVNNVHTRNEHWRSQVELLQTGSVDYTFIGKLENLDDDDAPTLLNYIGCDIDFPSQKKVSFAPTNATSKLEKYYTEQELKLVNALFLSDFEFFEYDLITDSLELKC